MFRNYMFTELGAGARITDSYVRIRRLFDNNRYGIIFIGVHRVIQVVDTKRALVNPGLEGDAAVSRLEFQIYPVL